VKHLILALPLIFTAFVTPQAECNSSGVHFSALSLELDGTVSYRLNDGTLQPQLLQLLQAYPTLRSSDRIVWAVNGDEIAVKKERVYRGITIDHVINNIADEYELLLFFYSSGGIAVVNKVQEGHSK
jgi:hypothetical protein